MGDITGLFITMPTVLAQDETLPDGAKILYGFIASLAQTNGYCYATNNYLAESAHISDKTVQSHLKKLKDAGYIDVEIIRTEKGEVKERQIRCMVSFKGEKIERKEHQKKTQEAVKHKYGSQQNVLLTDKQYSDLKALYPTIDDEIENMSLYCAANGKPYKNCYAALLNWMRRRANEEKPKGSKWDGVDY